jgi:hypothetical protein
MINAICIRLGGAVLVMGVILGFVPGYTTDTPYFSEKSISCGSPFMVSDDLSDEGLQECETDGGLSTRRAWALALIGAGIVLISSAAAREITSDDEKSE